MTPGEAFFLIREAILLRPELRHRAWPACVDEVPDLHPMLGFCYIATQVFCHLVPETIPYTRLRGHFWAQSPAGTIYDPTFDQFIGGFKDYELGTRTHFPKLTKRAKELLTTVESLQNVYTASRGI